MMNIKAMQKAQQKIGRYFIDLVRGDVKPLGIREIHREYGVSQTTLQYHLDSSYFKTEKNKKICILSEEKAKFLRSFFSANGKMLKDNEYKKLSEILFYTVNLI